MEHFIKLGTEWNRSDFTSVGQPNVAGLVIISVNKTPVHTPSTQTTRMTHGQVLLEQNRSLGHLSVLISARVLDYKCEGWCGSAHL